MLFRNLNRSTSDYIFQVMLITQSLSSFFFFLFVRRSLIIEQKARDYPIFYPFSTLIFILCLLVYYQLTLWCTHFDLWLILRIQDPFNNLPFKLKSIC